MQLTRNRWIREGFGGFEEDKEEEMFRQLIENALSREDPFAGLISQYLDMLFISIFVSFRFFSKLRFRNFFKKRL